MLLIHVVCVAAPLLLHDDAADRLFALLDRSVPASGTVEGVFADQEGMGEARAGFDFGTGAWFLATPSSLFGQETDGRVYYGDSGLGRSKLFNQDGVVESVAIANYIPSSMLAMLRKRHGLVDKVVETEGRFTATVNLPSASGKAVVFDIVVNADGRLTSFRREGFTEAQNAPIEYSPENGQLASKINGTQVKLVTVVKDPPKDQFLRARTESISAQLKLNEAKLKAAAVDASGVNNSELTSSASPLSPGAEWRVPLIGGGVVLVLVGAAAYLRKRQA